MWTRASRWQVTGIAVGTAFVGLLLTWSGLNAVLPPLRAMRSGAASVAYAPHDVIALPLAMTCFASAAMASPSLIGAQSRTGSGTDKLSDTPAATTLFGLALAGVLLAIMIVPIARAAMVQFASSRG